MAKKLQIINKEIYHQEIQWVYEVGRVNLERTIDRTLRNWLQRWYFRC